MISDQKTSRVMFSSAQEKEKAKAQLETEGCDGNDEQGDESSEQGGRNHVIIDHSKTAERFLNSISKLANEEFTLESSSSSSDNRFYIEFKIWSMGKHNDLVLQKYYNEMIFNACID